MKNIIIGTLNEQKFYAISKAIKACGSVATIDRIKVEGLPDVRPTTFEDVEHAAIEGVHALVRTFLKNDDSTQHPAIAICIQKGVIASEPSLACVIALRMTNTLPEQVRHVECERIALNPEIKTLIEGKKMDPYDAYRIVCGDDVADKKISLYEFLNPGKSEIDWMAEGIAKLL